MMASINSCSWHTLPNEMKLAVVENLDTNDAKSFSKVDQRTYEICVPATFRVRTDLPLCRTFIDEFLQNVKLNSLEQLESFLDNVPRSYCQHIQELDLCTQTQENVALRAQTDAVISLLLASPRLSTLALRMTGSLDKSVIAPFAYLRELRQLTITNCSEEEQAPL